MSARIPTRSKSARILGLTALLALLAAGAAAQQEGAAPQLQWLRGPDTPPIGDGLAEIDLAEEYVFLDAAGTQQMLEMGGNPISGTELATVAPISDEDHEYAKIMSLKSAE